MRSRNQPIDVAVVDDHDLVAAGLVRILDASGSFRVTGVFGTGEGFLRSLSDGLRPDVCLIDLSMPGLGGAETIKEAVRWHKDLVCVALSASCSPSVAANALASGASGYVTKSQSPEALIAAILTCVAGGSFVDPELGPLGSGQDAAGRALSPREFDVLTRLARGERIADIASDLCLSPKTVSTHRRRILDKLGLRSNVELAAYAADRGMVER
jgi:DNA-binding NarL/FixJ family response regulator